VAADPLVLVSAATVDPKALAAGADANPASHFALIGGSTAGFRRPNIVGVRFREDQAAFLAGSVAGLTARHANPSAPSVAWVGPENRALLGAFARGARAAAPGVAVRHRWSRDEPVYCKEAAIAAIQAGATVVAADDGLCAEGAATAAHEQGQAAVSVASFELRDVAAALIVKEARAGVYYGNEDLTLGAASGAIGIGTLDPAIPPSVVVQASVAAQQLAVGSGSSG
jgi:basic membrane lipoprotein Med (substrate-binding protein (PBP1-ABC) superfamily)